MITSSEFAIEFRGVSKIFSSNIDHGRANALKRILLFPLFQSASKGKSEFFALKDLNFSVQQGEKVAILGHDGAGKSTIAKLVLGVSEPTTGTVFVRSPARQPTSKLSVERPLMSLELYLKTLLSFLGCPGGDLRRLTDLVLSSTSMISKKRTRLRDLSDSELKRITLFASFLLPTDIFMLDEVKWDSLGDFERSRLGESTVIYFAARSDQIPTDFSRVLVLQDGVLVFDGSPHAAKELFSSLPPTQSREATKPILFPEGTGLEGEIPPMALESLPSAVDVVEQPEQKRKGSGAIRISQVQIKDKNGIPLERARTGEFIELEITYQSNALLPKSARITLANLVLEDENHVRILGLPSDVVPFHAPVDVASSGLLKCKIPRFPLLPGRFGITLAVLVDGTLADKCVNEHFIDVDAGDFYESGKLPLRFSGPFCTDFSWTHSSLQAKSTTKNAPAHQPNA
jgi:lipopolysaccharide transport system ATP-binding protein